MIADGLATGPNWIRKTAKRALTRRQRYAVRRGLAALRSRRARQAFQRAAVEPRWLDDEAFSALLSGSPPRASIPTEANELDGLQEASRAQMADLISALGDRIHQVQDVMEVGSQHGLVSAALQAMAKRVTAVDLRFIRYSEQAAAAGVRLHQSDAAQLEYEDRTFDLVVSFNAFEHFDEPEAVFEEMLRVLRPGGLLYASFGPLYHSPFGLHAWHEIGIPYCQHLFAKDTLRTALRGGATHDFWHLNHWSVNRFRELWQRHRHAYRRLMYFEGYNSDHLEWVVRYPSCFRSKTDCFEDLLVDRIELLFEKRSHEQGPSHEA